MKNTPVGHTIQYRKRFGQFGHRNSGIGSLRDSFFDGSTTSAVPAIPLPGLGGRAHPLFARFVLWHFVRKFLSYCNCYPKRWADQVDRRTGQREVPQYKHAANQSQVKSFTAPSRLQDILSDCRRMAILTGAGVSAESGLGTFRGKEGIWNKMRPEELASMAGFMANPELVWEWYSYRRSVLADAKPNAAHIALAEWQRHMNDFTLITQNVDGLHQLAGNRDVLELHGNIRVNRCLKCGQETTDDLLHQPIGIPRCPCGGSYRPGVVWFGEMLPEDILTAAFHAAESCDLFLTIGTSAVVYPAASLPEIALENGAHVIEINLEPTQFSPRATVSIHEPAGAAVTALFLEWKRLRAAQQSADAQDRT